MPGRLEGKVAIVTGAASGIGAATARLMAREGAWVLMTDVQDAAGEALAREIGKAAKFVHHDVAEEADWKAVMQVATQDLGGLDILVNNAGVLVYGTIESSTVADFRRAHAVMVEGTFLGCHHALREMRKGGGGSIINLSSIAAQLGQAHLLPYSAAKGAVRSLTKSVAVHCQMHKYNIRCNSVHPGPIHTAMFEDVKIASQKHLLPEFQKGSPVGRANPEEVANMILYLASDESKFVNGAEMVIDNAMSVQ
ncbi:MAG: SDR family oxidoreductase [Rhodospirillaceae bacterium]|nr:SDR family oxidoreductase [Rhodospirillaceae bacterium]